MKRGVFILSLLLAGCGDQGPPPELEEKEAELRRMQERLVEVQQSSSSEIAELEKELALARESVREESSQQEKLIQLLRAQTEALREENRKLLLENSRAGTAPPPLPPTPAPSFEQLEQAATKAEVPKPDFPVRVTKVQGRKVVTGSHNVKEFVPGDETYTDKFGRVRQDGQWVDKTVNQYGYEVVFSLINESEETVQLTARAGLASDTMTLAPGETRINAKLVAARGSGLWLLSDGKSLKMDVDFGEE